MDPTRFDHLTRSLWQSHSRRHVLALAVLMPALAPTRPVAAAPHPAHHRVTSVKRRCRAKGGRYFGPSEACPCASPGGDPDPTHFPCPISPDCTCYASASGGAICGTGFPFLNTVCATNADCIQSFGADYPLCIVTPGGARAGHACGPGLPPCSDSRQVCVSGHCQYTACVPACG